MIELTPLARPYAKALFASAKDSNGLEEMAEELKIMATASAVSYTHLTLPTILLV